MLAVFSMVYGVPSLLFACVFAISKKKPGNNRQCILDSISGVLVTAGFPTRIHGQEHICSRSLDGELGILHYKYMDTRNHRFRYRYWPAQGKVKRMIVVQVL